MSQTHSIATLDTNTVRDLHHGPPRTRTDDSAHNNRHVATCDKDKTQDVNHNIDHDLIHADQLSHTVIDQLSECERQNLESLNALNHQQTQARICAQRTPPAHKAGGPGAKRAGAKAVKKMEQHSTEYKLSSKDATTSRILTESELLEPRQS